MPAAERRWLTRMPSVISTDPEGLVVVPQAKCPTGKRRYLRRDEATEALQDLIFTAGSKEHPKRLARLGVYLGERCCGGWHIGHNYGPSCLRTARRGKHKKRPNQAQKSPTKITA